MLRTGLLCTLIPALFLSACGDDGGDVTDSEGADTTGTATGDEPSTGEPTPTTGGPVEAQRPNWHEDIAPLTAVHCRGCHAPGGIAPFAMMSHEETAPWAGAMAADVELALMPPWHGVETDECQPPFAYKHDARLSDAQKQLFIDWAELGAPEGDPKLAAPLPEPPSLDLAGVTGTATMQSEVTIPAASATVRDYFNCLSIDPGNQETVYLDGLQLIAGNPAVVHHVLVYVDAKAESASWPGGVKSDCGGGSGIAGGQLIAGWVPGSMPIEPPKDVGTEVPPGTRLILNVHYHAVATEQKDSKTGVALRWKTSEPAWSSVFALVGDPGLGDSLHGPLMIPANESGHVEEYVWEVAGMGQALPDILDVRVWAALNHMHKIGIDLKVWVEDRDSGAETCLLQTPRWDYNWQRSYAFDSPIDEGFRVRGGDKVHVRCTYDNSLANPGVMEVLQELGMDAPFDVTLGEGTLNEMCLTGLGLAVKGGL